MTDDRRAGEELDLVRAVAGGWPPAYRLAFAWQRVSIAWWTAATVNLVLWAVDVRDGIEFSLTVQAPWLSVVLAEALGRRVRRNRLLPRRFALGRRALAFELGLIVAAATPFVLLVVIGQRAEFYVLGLGLGVVAVLTRPATSWVDFVTAARQDDDERQLAARERDRPPADPAAPAEPWAAGRFDLVVVAAIVLVFVALAYRFLPHDPANGPYVRVVIPALLLIGLAAGLWRGLLNIRRREADRLAEASAAAGAAVGRRSARDERRAAALEVLPTGAGVAAAVVRALVVLGVGALVAEELVDAPTLPWIAAGVTFLVDRAICAVVRGGRRDAPETDWSSPAMAGAARSLRADEPGASVLIALVAIGIVGAAWWLVDAGGLASTPPLLLGLAAAVVGVAVAELFAEVGARSRSRPSDHDAAPR